MIRRIRTHLISNSHRLSAAIMHARTAISIIRSMPIRMIVLQRLTIPCMIPLICPPAARANAFVCWSFPLTLFFRRITWEAKSESPAEALVKKICISIACRSSPDKPLTFFSATEGTVQVSSAMHFSRSVLSFPASSLFKEAIRFFCALVSFGPEN